MKDTALSAIHAALGAKMVPFAGYNMPVSYQGINLEHQTVREKVGVFDVSHMGEFFVTGPNALSLIQRVCSNDASKLEDGEAQYSCFPNQDGGVVDDLIVYRIAAEKWVLVVNASNIDKDWAWINSHNTMEATLENSSDHYSLLAIQGPKAIQAMQSLTQEDLSAIKFYTFKINTFAGVENVIISATGYTGSGGFEIYCKNTQVAKIWTKVLEAGADWGIQPIGLAARDTLRLEMGYCLYGNDIDDFTSPIEAGLKWATKTNKDFIGKKHILNTVKNGIEKKLIGFVLNERGIPRKGYKIFDSDQNEIGLVTSGTMSPMLKKGIGMGYVKFSNSELGTEIFIQIRNKFIKSKIVKPPFIK